MDLYMKHSINLVPVLGVDFSLANLTLDETQYCLHTLKVDAPNDYIDCLKSVSKTFYHFNRFMLAYGFGARPFLDDNKPATNLFSMTGDFADPYVYDGKSLIKHYEDTIKSVKLALPVMYKDIVKFTCDVAQKEMGREEGGDENIQEVKNYYVLVLIMAGMVDDFNATIK
mmetsp:Transcript_19177/g.29368  ORF Transcript_19177/g.29368 Transcript_19177/m.29368 type:complete len:170 (+) Transcript_19177:1235-1744(+)